MSIGLYTLILGGAFCKKAIKVKMHCFKKPSNLFQIWGYILQNAALKSSCKGTKWLTSAPCMEGMQDVCLSLGRGYGCYC